MHAFNLYVDWAASGYADPLVFSFIVVGRVIVYVVVEVVTYSVARTISITINIHITVNYAQELYTVYRVTAVM